MRSHDEKLPPLQVMDSRAPLFVAACSMLFFATLDALLKAATINLPVFEVVFLRFVAGSLFAGLFFLRSGQALPPLEAFRANLLRAVVATIAAMSFIYAVSVLTLADAVVLAYCAPFFIVLFGRVLLGERITRVATIAILVGFGGVVLIVSGQLSLPTGSGHLLGSISALLSAAAYAFSVFMLRYRSNRDSAEFTVFILNIYSGVIAAPFVLAVWQTPTTSDLALFLVIGLVSFLSHGLMVWAVQRAELWRVAPLEFTGLIWATLFGVYLFGEALTVNTVLGGLLIAGSGILVVSRSRPQIATSD